MLEKALVNGNKRLDSLTLNQLVYVAHGWILGAYSKPLIDNTVDQIQAWAHGPIVVNLHYLTQSFQTTPLNLYDFYAILAKRSNSYNENILPNPKRSRPSGLEDLDHHYPKVVKGLDWVYKTYTPYSGGQLLTLTTQENSPWALRYRPGLLERWRLIHIDRHIPDYIISNHYSGRIGT